VLEASVQEHRAIAAAILEPNPEAAAGQMRAHLERAAALALASRASETGARQAGIACSDVPL
jgi:DNA-binding FadR family transcriptional regulator